MFGIIYVYWMCLVSPLLCMCGVYLLVYEYVSVCEHVRMHVFHTEVLSRST